MRIALRTLSRILVFLAVCLAASVGTAFLQYWMELSPSPSATTSSILLSGALTLLLPIVLAFNAVFAIPALRPRVRAPLLRVPKMLVGSLLAGTYLLTWLLGAPQVRAALQHDTLERSYVARSSRASVRPEFSSACRFVIPLLPGVLLSYHEYHIAALNAGGAWYIHLWYLAGVVQLAKRPTWIS